MDMQKVREELGVRQCQLAEMLGCGRPMVNDIERGRRVMSRGVTARLALLRVAKVVEGRDTPVANRLREIVEDGLGG